MQSLHVKVTPPQGIHARQAVMLVYVQHNLFPKDEVVLINHETGAEAPMVSLIALLNLGAEQNHHIEFITVMDVTTFALFKELMLLLCYTPRRDKRGRLDVEYFDTDILRLGNAETVINALRGVASLPQVQRVFVPLGQAEQAPLPEAIRMMEPPQSKKVFISYSHHDLPFVLQSVVPVVKAAGFSPWFSTDNIRGADRWERAIVTALQTSEWFVVLSPNAIGSEWVRLEVHWAAEHRVGRIIPVLFQKCNAWDIHMILGPLQYIDFNAPSDILITQLKDLLQSAP
jgi:phosphotransferase system HPr-like phosphotransfer protein